MCLDEAQISGERFSGSLVLWFVVFLCAHVFSYAQWSFFNYIKKTVSRLSRTYPLSFAIKILMVVQFQDL